MFDGVPSKPHRIDTPASLLIAEGMRRIKKERDWCRNALWQDRWLRFSPRHCALGAIGIAVLGERFSTKAFFEGRIADLELAIAAMTRVAERWGYREFDDLNNDRRNSHADVLAAMEEARLAAQADATVCESVG